MPLRRKRFLAALVFFWRMWFGVIHRGIEIPLPVFLGGLGWCGTGIAIPRALFLGDGWLGLVGSRRKWRFL